MKEPTQIDWARLAAFIDGEGAILLNRFKPQKERGACRKRMWLRIAITNCDERLICWLKETFGGSIALEKRSHVPNQTDCYRWYASCRLAGHVLRGCLPYFIVKREQAVLGLEFQKTIGTPGVNTTEEVHDLREQLRAKLHELKSRKKANFDPSVEAFIPAMKRGSKPKQEIVQ